MTGTQRTLGQPGLGLLEPLLGLDGVTEVMVNGPGNVWIDRAGSLERSDITIDHYTLDHIVESIVGPLGRRLDRTSPLVDARLNDGSRVHVVALPIAVDGPYLTIRKFRPKPFELSEIASDAVVELLARSVRTRANVLVSGGSSSGKTTLLNAMARHIPEGQRVLTIEDAAELSLGDRHVVRLETRPPTIDGPAQITMRELVRNALRMRPDRIIVGEVRGPEALDMVQAMNTGHEGSMSTCHANSPQDALRRLEVMIMIGDSGLPIESVRWLVTSAIDVVVHLQRNPDGSREISAVAEPVIGANEVVELANFSRVVRRSTRARRAPHP